MDKYFTPVISLVLLLFAGVIFLSFRQTSHTKNTAALVAHTQEVLFHAEQVISTVKDNETGARGFVITGRQAFLEPLQKSKENIRKQIDALKDLTKDNASQQSLIDSLLIYINKRILFSDSLVHLRNEKGLQAAVQLVSTGLGKGSMDHLREITASMEKEETRLLQLRKAANEKADRLLIGTTIAIIIIILVLIIILLRRDWLHRTAQKMAESTLKKSEENFRLLIGSVKDYAIFLLDLNGHVASWNVGAEQIKGYSEKEIIGKSFEGFYSKEDVDKGEPHQNLEMAKRLGHYETEGWRIKKDGSRFWANVVFTALRDDSGALSGFSKITRDITERKKAQDDLAFLVRQINLSNDAIYTMGTDFKIKSWNRGAENMYGFTEAEALGKDSNKILRTSIEPEKIRLLVEVIEQRDHWSGELMRKTKSGHDIFVSASSTAIRDDQGLITGYVAVNLDITRQKKLREQVNHLATMVEQTTEAIISRGPDQRIISWNNGAERLFGYSKGEAIGKTFSELGYVKLSPGQILEIEKQISEGGTWRAEMDYFHKNGSSFFGTVTGNGSKDEHGNVHAFIFIIRDISQRKKLEDDLKKLNDGLERKVKERTEEIYRNERRFRTLIENSNDMITLLDESQQRIYRSPSTARILGWGDDEIDREGDPNNSIHPEDLQKAQRMFAEARANPGKPVHAQLRWMHQGGHYLWLEGVVTNFLDDDHIKAFVTNFRDVTERVEAEEKLASSELRFRSLIESSAEGVSLLDERSNVIYRSPSAYRIVGDSPTENSIGHAYPDDLGIFRDKFAEALGKPGVPIPYQARFYHADGHYFWTEGTFTNLLHVPGVNAVVANYRDVSERKKMMDQITEHQEQLELFIGHSPVSLAMFDLEMRYISVSRRWIVDYDLGARESELIGKSHYEIFPAIPSEWRTIHQQCLNGAIVKKEEDSFIQADGSQEWLRWEIHPWHKASGEIGGIIIFSEFITERKMAEEKIKNLNIELEEKVAQRTAELQKANMEMEAFSYSVSHDLRAPLRAIIGFTNILEEDYGSALDDEAKRITHIIKGSTSKMGQLIDDLLTFARMGRQDITRAPIDANKLVDEIITGLAPHKGGAHIKWKIHPLPTAKADLGTIKQVWINLISNAIKYSGKADSPEIEIGSYADGGQVVFFIKDNGIGFDEKYKEKLFKVFQRLHSSEEFDGTGIGLAIVEKIISKHGGRVWAEARPNMGACFYFSLPSFRDTTNKTTENEP